MTLSADVITTNLLRLYDFGLTRAKRKTRCHFVHAQRTLARPFFRPFQERHPCTLMSEEHLTRYYEEHILCWATSPIVVDDIIVSDDD